MFVWFASFLTDSPPLAAQGRVPVYQGFTEPSQDILVSTSEMGEIMEVLVKTGDRVAKGQIVFELDRQRQEAGARLSEIQANMTGEIRLAEAEVQLHQRRTTKLKELADSGAARQEEWLRSQSALASAQAKLRIALEQQATRQQQFRRDQLLLDRRSIKSPTDGVVGEVLREAGESITPADPSLMRLVVLDPLAAVVNLPANDVEGIRVGTQLPVFLQNSQTTVNAIVTEISPTIDKESGTTIVRLEFPNPELKFKAGDQCTLDQPPNPSLRGVDGRDQVKAPPAAAGPVGSPSERRLRELPWRPGSTKHASPTWIGPKALTPRPTSVVKRAPHRPAIETPVPTELAERIQLVRRAPISLDSRVPGAQNHPSQNPASPKKRSAEVWDPHRVETDAGLPEPKAVELIRPRPKILDVPRVAPNPLREAPRR